MRVRSLLMQLEIGMSISRYLPPIGTAGLLRCLVRGYSRFPWPPPRMMLSTRDMGTGLVSSETAGGPGGSGPAAHRNTGSDRGDGEKSVPENTTQLAAMHKLRPLVSRPPSPIGGSKGGAKHWARTQHLPERAAATSSRNGGHRIGAKRVGRPQTRRKL